MIKNHLHMKGKKQKHRKENLMSEHVLQYQSGRKQKIQMTQGP